ncbi:hypothetical protein ACNTMW_00735 [Planosporangium sp. 12N6]|uniref:hypothetical protein n=1 Tax=Planosporangium spinosum TaxID=3402278 RepID=UPI003CF36E36
MTAPSTTAPSTTALLGSELLKLRTVRTPRYTLLGLLVFVSTIAGVAATAVPRAGVPGEGTAGELLRTVLGVAGGLFPAMVALLLGALSAAGEYHHGTILGTYLVTPDRHRVLAAKLLVTSAVGAAVGLACAVLALALAVPVAHTRALDTGLTDAGAWAGLIVTCTGVTALGGALGVGLGVCFRQPVVAVVAVLAWMSFGEGLVSAVVPEALVPFGAIRTAVTATSAVDVGIGAAALAVHATVVVVLAAQVFTRKDVTV